MLAVDEMVVVVPPLVHLTMQRRGQKAEMTWFVMVVGPMES